MNSTQIPDNGYLEGKYFCMHHYRCCFCDSNELRLRYRSQFHPLKKDHGPFDFYNCSNCHSGLTLPVPAASAITNLYSSFADGMDVATRQNRDSHPLTTWYNQCIDRALINFADKNDTGESFNWIDIGAGKGELATLMAKKYPRSKGVAIDFHARPALLDDIPNVTWMQCDLNDPIFYTRLNDATFNIVFSITVLEHVLHPSVFLQNLLPLLAGNGVLYLTVPDYSSWASRILGSKWPYYIPGEHINIPSRNGLLELLKRLLNETSCPAGPAQPFCNRIILPYPLAYYLQFLRLSSVAKMLGRRELTLKLPTGILEAGFSL